MVKKPNVRQEHFQLVQKQVEFWDKTIELDKEMLKHDKQSRTKAVRKLLELQKRYAEQ
jgi:hypothetical protein